VNIELIRAALPITSNNFVWWLLWAGLFVISIALLLLMRTRWGQAKPLRKCAVLSLLAHVLLACYATTVQIVQISAEEDEAVLRIASLEDGDDLDDPASRDRQPRDLEPWEMFANEVAAEVPVPGPSATQPEPLVAERGETEPSMLSDFPADATASSGPTAPDLPQVNDLPSTGERPEAIEAAQIAEHSRPKRKQTVSTPTPTASGPSRPTDLDDLSPTANALPEASDDGGDTLTPLPSSPTDSRPSLPTPQPSLAELMEAEMGDEAGDAGGGNATPNEADLATNTARPAPLAELSLDAAAGQGTDEPPAIYENRTSDNKLPFVVENGGTAETEAAVEKALTWLAENQGEDGRWDASRHEAGRENRVDQRDRRNAGAKADTAVTGLALLAFFGAGHTHQQGDYQATVAAGIDFLLRSQNTDGSLGGEAAHFAFMYAHGMATLAISEAYAMTHDERIRPALIKALNYTLRAQHPSTGGWRYRPGDLGDTSQLGWQLMALHSAKLGGIPVPEASRQGTIRYLQSVASGQHGGHASYRPGERVSRTMTAEALVCRQFLGMQRSNPAADEAGALLLAELPGEGRPNLYYWYYGTLGMYQLGGVYWEKWNEALKATLIARQRTDGPLSGSWDADTMWGSYGGRVFTTALGALCLEVYYRYLPMYAETARGDAPIRR